MQENEDIEEITEEEGEGINATGAGTPYDSGVTRGKGNPISNTGTWESGADRGKGNPISNHGNWESGVARGKGNPLTVSEQVQKMKDLIAKL